ncbi:MAG: zf-TFIIB domain-containing protein [Candidatus Wallbacteria bacterium]|nr:zf-TFIIB domain-containing protein [Candidatus Wallbacteria bacterium]
MQLHCPRCRSLLRQATYEGITIQQCERCSGQWLGGPELRTIIDARERQFSEEERARLAAHEKTFSPDRLASEQILDCPKCTGPMNKFRYAGDSPVVIDRCAACEGTWLDGGELEHVQILAETWEQDLAGDLAQHGARLNRLRLDADEKLTPKLHVNSPLLRGLLGGFVRFWE